MMWSLSTQRKPSSLASLLRAVLVALAALAAGAGGLAAQERPVNIAIVNLDYVVAQSPAGKDLQAKLDQFAQSVKAEVETRNQTARDVRQRIADGANTLSAEKLAELQRQYEDAQISIKRYQDDKTREGQKMQNDGLREIEKQLEPVFTQIRDEGGYDLILNNVPGVVVMAGPRIDITQKVVDRLQAGSAGG